MRSKGQPKHAIPRRPDRVHRTKSPALPKIFTGVRSKVLDRKTPAKERGREVRTQIIGLAHRRSDWMPEPKRTGSFCEEGKALHDRGSRPFHPLIGSLPDLVCQCRRDNRAFSLQNVRSIAPSDVLAFIAAQPIRTGKAEAGYSPKIKTV
jgi:hypothetical protein